MFVVKRNGEKVAFDKNKIINAILKANMTVGKKYKISEHNANQIAGHIERLIQTDTIRSVEEIQEVVENALMSIGCYELAKRYIRYRYHHNITRLKNTTDDDILTLIGAKNKDVMEENANKNAYIVSTQRDLMAGEVSKDISKRLLLPKDIVEAHNEGVLHFHDLDYFIQPMHNCFSGDTKFLTKDYGLKRFNEFNDGELVTVLNKNGKWVEATVNKYGKQVMYDVTLSNGNSKDVVITCTKNHRWVLKDGSETTDLKIGDTLYPLQYMKDVVIMETKRDYEMFCFGFIIGDGNNVKDDYLSIRLCGDKNAYANTFRCAEYSCRQVVEGDHVFIKRSDYNKQEFLQAKAWRYLNSRDKALLFRGLYCADGCTDRNMFATSNSDIVELVKECSYLEGYHISSIKKIIHNTNFKENATLYEIRFRQHNSLNKCWKVKDICLHDKYGRKQEAWCVNVPDTHTFTLEYGIVTGNCCLINIKDMLENGTVMNGKLIETPKSFQVACTVMTQIIACVASSQYGGQSVAIKHLGKYLKLSEDKFRKEIAETLGVDRKSKYDPLDRLVAERLRSELRSGVQTIQYQINTLMTTNGQSPFVTIFMELDKNDPYLEYTAMIIEEILKQRYEGIKNEKGVYITPAFPKLIYVLDEINMHGGKYDYITKLAGKCSAKRMYPDYISAKKMRENYDGEVFSCMGCRSFLSPWKDKDGKYKWEGRFNMGVVSINLPQIGILSGGEQEVFWELLDERLALCKKALMCRYERLKGTPSDVSPIHWQYGALARLKKGETIDPLLENGYSTISLGYIGLYEVTKLMTGKSHTSDIGKVFAKDVMESLRRHCEEWKRETGLGFGLYGTPAESLCYRFARIDKERFGDIKDVTDKGYYTNSYHVDVRETINAFDKLDFESQFQKISSGGAISYVEIPNLRHNLEAIYTLIDFIYDHIQYAEFNTKSDYCHVCGYDGEIIINDNNEWECPNCHNKDHKQMNVTRRVCGYLGENFFNVGKTKEIKSRKLHL